jgi:hypothetical protein
VNIHSDEVYFPRYSPRVSCLGCGRRGDRSILDSGGKRNDGCRNARLYLLGVPIPIIILIGLFSHFWKFSELARQLAE